MLDKNADTLYNLVIPNYKARRDKPPKKAQKNKKAK